jgi:hypothetical protein
VNLPATKNELLKRLQLRSGFSPASAALMITALPLIPPDFAPSSVCRLFLDGYLFSLTSRSCSLFLPSALLSATSFVSKDALLL